MSGDDPKQTTALSPVELAAMALGEREASGAVLTLDAIDEMLDLGDELSATQAYALEIQEGARESRQREGAYRAIAQSQESIREHVASLIAASELRHVEERGVLRAVLNRIEEAIEVFDPHGDLWERNQAAMNILGLPDRYLQGGLERVSEVVDVRYPDGSPMPREQWPVSRAYKGEESRLMALIANGRSLIVRCCYPIDRLDADGKLARRYVAVHYLPAREP